MDKKCALKNGKTQGKENKENYDFFCGAEKTGNKRSVKGNGN